RPPQRLMPISPAASDGAQPPAAGVDPTGREPTPSASLWSEEQARLVQAALAKIADETGREILRLRFFEGLSLRQAAQQLGLTYAQARGRYQSSLQHLETELGPLL